MMIKQRSLTFVVFLTLLFSSLSVWAVSDPVSVLNSVANQLISALKSNKANLRSNPSLVYSLAYRIVVPKANVDEMAKRVLPPQTWNSATPQQRREFKSQFTTVLVRTYASALAEYNDQTIEFFPVRGGYQGKREVQVNSTIIRTDGPAISVNYRMVLTGSQWKLYDMIVEGVSMLESFRSQFSDELSRGDMASLIQRLRQHNGANG